MKMLLYVYNCKIVHGLKLWPSIQFLLLGIACGIIFENQLLFNVCKIFSEERFAKHFQQMLFL